MSDLHQAVQAEIAAHTPALPPSFEALKARKRARDRRRMVVAGAVLPAAAVAFAVVVVPSLTGDGDRLAPDPGPAAGPLFVQEDLPPDATVIGTARVEGALIDPVDPTYLILSVGGAASVPQDDPCWEGYRASVTEDGPKIKVIVERLQRVAASVGRSCLGVGGTRPVGVAVGSPVGDRQVHDASSGVTIRPFDGDRLLRPAYLPPGYQESAAPGLGADGTWLRFYSGPSNTSPITVKQEAGEHLTPPDPRATIESRPTVNGHPATVYVVGEPGSLVQRTVQWSAAGQTVTVQGSQLTPAIGPSAAEQLLRVAQGLEAQPRRD